MVVDSIANGILDSLLGVTGLFPATVYIGLMTTSPNPSGSGVVEPVGGSYGRVAVVNNATQWPAAASRLKTHANDIVFPTATANWGTVTYVGIFDAASGGNLLAYGALSVPRNVLNGDIFRFLAGTATELDLTI